MSATTIDPRVDVAYTIAQLERNHPELLKKVVRAAEQGEEIHPTPEEWEILHRSDWLRHPARRSDRTVRAEYLRGVSFLREEVLECVLTFVSLEGDTIFLRLMIAQNNPLYSQIEEALKSAEAHLREKLLFFSEAEKKRS